MFVLRVFRYSANCDLAFTITDTEIDDCTIDTLIRCYVLRLEFVLHLLEVELCAGIVADLSISLLSSQLDCDF